MRLTGLLAALALLAGCSTNPITGREQILPLPAVQAAHANVSFALSSGPQGIGAAPACEQECASVEAPASFPGRVARIGVRLEASARDMAPDLFERIGKFQIEMNDAIGVGTGSSAGGRIVLGTGLAGLELTDTVIAFLIAREMAHVIARHAEEDSGASIVFSALGMLLPGVNFIARFVASRLGSSVLTGSWAALQQSEADEIAMGLLEQAGLRAGTVALELDIGINHARLPDGEWATRYLESARRAERIAASPPRYAAISD
jgi:Zn-dependent protease with chaperone function